MKRWYLFQVALLCWAIGSSTEGQAGRFRAGVAKVDVSPPVLPVIQNGGFLESSLGKVLDPLSARAFVLDDGNESVALVVVDSCMIPRTLCDQAKALAAQRTGLRTDRIMISATHTHTAPSVMDFCLGSRQDPRYTRFLPDRIAEAIEAAHANLQAARMGTVRVDAGRFTANRRWITRPDKMGVDPFGEQTVRAMMHPGHKNPDYIGPSGPIDPWLTLMSLQTIDGKPLGLFANFSMHYFGGHPGVSADYYGEFARQISARFSRDHPNFLAAMSQGTSGDLWWGDYGLPQRQGWSLKEYTEGIVELALSALSGVEHQDELTLAMAEEQVTLARRLPDADRLEWAREKVAALKGQRPKNRPDVYAEQAVYIHENPAEEIVLQALRIGELAMTALPNEVYALTGLRLKAMSPLPLTLNLGLANGAAGYIPPPEQHDLGGYTTWPARTAGLERRAEPKIVAILGNLLERVTRKPLRQYREPEGDYATAVKRSEPLHRWRMGDQSRSFAVPSVRAEAVFEGQVAFHLDGVQGRGFGGDYESKSVHFAGGHLRVPLEEAAGEYAVEFWFNSSLSEKDYSSLGALYQRGNEVLELTGRSSDLPGRLKWGRTIGETPIQSNAWYHLAVVRRSHRVQIFLNGVSKPEIDLALTDPSPEGAMSLAGRLDGTDQFEGKLDEVAYYDRVLAPVEIRDHFRAAGLEASAALTPSESMALTHVREGFRLELVAAEPLVQDPVAIDWGVDGRMWVAEMADYPYGMDGVGQPGGRIRVLSDQDGDGNFDQSQVFLEGINFPTSVMPWRKGVLVTAAPELFYAEDVDGDGRADRREVLFRGFMEGNQQLRVNSLRWGLDGWVYCASGGHHAGFGAKNGIDAIRWGRSVLLGSRDFRFQPDTGALEALSGPSQFGRVRDDWGRWFGVQNSRPLWHYALSDPDLQRNPAVPYPDPKVQLRTPINPRVYMNKPVQKRYHSFEQSSRFTSACGPTIYRDVRLFPDEPGVQHAFTCEPFHNVVQHHVLTESSFSFAGRRAHEDGVRDFYASGDRWSRPVMARTGPDGALYVVDMYRYMIEHPDWLPPEGKEELKPFYRSGEDHGRIYRIVRSMDTTPSVAGRAMTSDEELLAGLQSSNGRVRDLVHQRIIESQAMTVVPELVALLRTSPHPKTRLQVMACLHGLGRWNVPLADASLRDPVAGVRRQAILFATELASESPGLEQTLLGLRKDPDPKVRLELALSLGDLNSAAAGEALVELATWGRRDPVFIGAVMSSATPHFDAMLSLLTRPEYVRPLMIMGASNSAFIQKVAEWIREQSDVPYDALSVWIESLESDGRTWYEELESLGGMTPEHLVAVRRLVSTASRRAADPKLELGQRVQCFPLLGRIAAHRARDQQLLLGCLEPTQDRRLRSAALSNLSRFSDPSVGQQVLNRWRGLLPGDRPAGLRLLLSRRDWSLQLLEAMESGVVLPNEVSASQRQQLLRLGDEAMRSRAQALFERNESGSNDSQLQIFRGAITRAGDRTAGRQHFEQRCGTCHELAGVGRAIGPNLRSVSDRTPASFLASIVQPNLSVEPKYVAYDVVLKDGRQLYGMVVRETGSGLTMRALDGSEATFLRRHIESVKSASASFMPEGLADGMSEKDMADLLAFLTHETR